MRQREVNEPIPRGLEFDEKTYVDMYRLLGLAKYSERFKIPAGIYPDDEW